MKLCEDLSLVLVRTKLVPNQFFDDIFSENLFFPVFFGNYINENFGIFSCDF